MAQPIYCEELDELIVTAWHNAYRGSKIPGPLARRDGQRNQSVMLGNLLEVFQCSKCDGEFLVQAILAHIAACETCRTYCDVN